VDTASVDCGFQSKQLHATLLVFEFMAGGRDAMTDTQTITRRGLARPGNSSLRSEIVPPVLQGVSPASISNKLCRRAGGATWLL